VSGARTPGRRTMTAREASALLGFSERHIRRVVAEPRHEFLARAAERQLKAAELKDQGKSYREIGEALKCTPKAAENLVLRGRKARLKQAS
jgi:DNA-directed RNA polymerase specialized sigma24 family protein